MRKTLVIAAREYRAAICTRSFIISLVMIPALMGASILVQRWLPATASKHFVLVNHHAPTEMIAQVQAAIEEYNQSEPVKSATRPRFVIVRVEDAAGSALAIEQQRLKLSEQVRAGALTGFMEMIPAEQAPEAASGGMLPGLPGAQAQLCLRYETNRPTNAEFSLFMKEVATRIRPGRSCMTTGRIESWPSSRPCFSQWFSSRWGCRAQ